MSGHKIITIGRQFGSGGREIGQKLAERLGIPLYDRRLVTMAAEALGVREEDAERVDESSLNSFVSNYTVSPGMYMEFISATPYIQSFDDEVYKKEAEVGLEEMVVIMAVEVEDMEKEVMVEMVPEVEEDTMQKEETTKEVEELMDLVEIKVKPVEWEVAEELEHKVGMEFV